MAAVHAIGSEPHFAGISDAIAQLPMVLLFFCGTRQRAKRRHALTLSKTGLVALVESMHYWHSTLLVWEIWRSHHPEIDTTWGAVSVILLVLPTILMLPVSLALVVIAMNSTAAQLVDPAAVRAHPRAVAIIILLSALHIELVSMLPWRTSSWASFPIRNVLLCLATMLIMHKGSILVLSVHFVQVEPTTFGIYILVFSALSLLQVLLEKAVFVAGTAYSRKAGMTKSATHACVTYPPVQREPVQQERSQTSSTLLPESLDQVLLTTRVRRLHSMLRPAQQWIMHSPGVLRAMAAESEMRITKGRVYLEQSAAAGAADANGLLEQWPLATLVSVKRRRHELRHTALELTMAAQQDGQSGAQVSVLLEFNSRDDRETAVQALLTDRPQLVPPDERLQEMTEKWHTGEVDNYTYLLHLNDCASRSFSDLSQYPIMCAIACSSLPRPITADAILLARAGPGCSATTEASRST